MTKNSDTFNFMITFNLHKRISSTNIIKAVLGMLAKGTEARKCGLIEEEAGGACDCKIISKNVTRKIRYFVAR